MSDEPDPSERDVRRRLEDVRDEARALEDLLVEPLTLANTRAELEATLAAYARLDVDE